MKKEKIKPTSNQKKGESKTNKRQSFKVKIYYNNVKKKVEREEENLIDRAQTHLIK